MSAFHKYGAIVFLLSLYLIAAKIGSSFSDALKIFGAMMWVLAIAMFAYLVLFKGMKISLFGGQGANDNLDFEEFEEEELADDVAKAANDAGAEKPRSTPPAE